MQASMRAAQASRLLSASSSVTSVVQRSASGATSHIPFASAPCCSPSYQIPSAASWPTLRRSLACHSASTDGAESDSTDSDSSVGLRKNFARPQIKTPLTKQQAAALLKSDGTEATWREMDSKLNKYPTKRTFTAIGSGGEQFKQDITKAVEGVVGSVPQDAVSERPSSGGQYLAVRLTVEVQSPDQVIQVYQAIKANKQLKWCM